MNKGKHDALSSVPMKSGRHTQGRIGVRVSFLSRHTVIDIKMCSAQDTASHPANQH